MARSLLIQWGTSIRAGSRLFIISYYKLSVVAFLVTLLFSPATFAQVRRVQTTSIAYKKGTPKSAIGLMPKGAKSLFWGTFSDGKNAAQKAIHLFAVDPKAQFVNDYKKRKFDGYHLTLDLFERQGQKWTRFNCVPVGYRTSLWGPLLVSADFVWIDEEKKMPLLDLRCFTKDGRWYGDELFLSFARNWKSPPTLQVAEYGASSYSSVLHFFQRAGKETIGIVQNSASAHIETTSIAHFRWNNAKRKFIVAPKTASLLDGDLQMWRP